MLSILLTIPLVAGMSLLLQGTISVDFLITGAVASVVVASVVTAMSLYFQCQLSLVQSDNQHLNAIINACPVPLALNDDAKNILLLNPEFIRIFGYTLTDIPTLKDWWPKAYPDPVYRQWVVDSWRSNLQSMQANNTPFKPLELKIRCKDEKDRIVMGSAASLGSAHEGPHLVILYDISEKADMTNQIAESHKLLQSIVETIPARVFWKDLDSRYLGCNTAFAHDAGKTDQTEIIGKFDTDLVWKSQANLYRADDQAVMRSGNAKLSYDEPQTTPAGQTIWLRTSKAPLRDTDSNIIGVLGVYEDISERKKIETELWLTKAVIDKSKTAFFWLSPSGMVQYVNDYACQSLGYTRKELIGMHPWDFDPDFACTRWPSTWKQLRQDQVVNLESRHRRKDGTVFNVDVTGHYISHGSEEFVFTFIQDITERKRIESELRIAATAFESQEGMIITDADTVILKINRSFTHITGFTAEEAVGKKMNLLKSGIHDDTFYTELWNGVKHTGFWQGEIWNRRKNGEVYPEWLTITAVKDNDGKVSHYVGTMIDITARKAIEERLHHLAYHDVLTNLPNRALLFDRLHQCLAQARRGTKKLALMFLDLDKFKQVNDSLGHDIGDLLLREVAYRLQSCVQRESDTVSRLGGDEFVILLSHIRQKDDVAVVANKIIDTLKRPFEIEQYSIVISTSIGIAIGPTDAVDVKSLIKMADDAMYQAKQNGGCFQFYSGDA